MNRIPSTLLPGLALLLAGMPPNARADIFKPGTGLPDVELLDGGSADAVAPAGHGKLINLRSLKGKKTVLLIFASW